MRQVLPARRVRHALIVGVVAVACAVPGCTDATDPSRRDGGADSVETSESGDGRPDAALPADCSADAVPERLVPEVLGERPHDPSAFTQGLLLLDGVLYESTGLEGESSVRAVDPSTGEVLRRSDLDPSSFGEGLTGVGKDRLVQLTWKEGRAEVRDRSDLRVVDEHRYDGEGWGITTLADGTLVMSDGSASLSVRDPDDFSLQERWQVARVDGDADRLNELEWDGDRIWANRWQTDEIVRIDPRCRAVDGVVDASRLTERAAQAASAPIDVLNGIAHVPGSDRFLVTGKLWPVVYEVRFVPAERG